jgi:hypothetical protein
MTLILRQAVERSECNGIARIARGLKVEPWQLLKDE